MKESDVLAQNVFSQKQITIQISSLCHCDQHAWKLQGVLSFALLFYAQNVFSQKQIIIQLWNLYHCNWNTWKLQGVVSLGLSKESGVLAQMEMVQCCWQGMPEKSGCTAFGPLIQRKNSPKWLSYSFETCTVAIGMPENIRVCWVWPSKF